MVGLFVIASLVVARVGILISKTFSPATAARISSSVKIDYGDTDDVDHDGLKDAEEAVWGSDPYNPDTDADGFLDGEEILSGYDPLRADNDSLAKQKEFLGLNSTQRLAQAITGGILSGDLKTNNPQTFAQSVNSVATATVYSTLAALESVEVGEDQITNQVTGSKTNRELYLEIVSETISEDIVNLVFKENQEILLLFSPDQTAIPDELNPDAIFSTEQKENIKNKFLQYAVKFQQAFDKLSDIPVPEDWVKTHQKVLTLLKKLELYHRSIALSNDDSLKQTIILSNLQNVYLQSQPIVMEINNRIRKEQLKSPDNNFFDINAFLN
ncbi:MAG: calcium-binding protein [Parcubacteria group bacterium Gr01-1014_44]|nr:MAG: calcium-binding protein [Parcubacteria group bacterium Gr01-1014_44]